MPASSTAAPAPSASGRSSWRPNSADEEPKPSSTAALGPRQQRLLASPASRPQALSRIDTSAGRLENRCHPLPGARERYGIPGPGAEARFIGSSSGMSGRSLDLCERLAHGDETSLGPEP